MTKDKRNRKRPPFSSASASNAGRRQDGSSLDALGVSHVLSAVTDPARVRVPGARVRLGLAVLDEESVDLAAHVISPCPSHPRCSSPSSAFTQLFT